MVRDKKSLSRHIHPIFILCEQFAYPFVTNPQRQALVPMLIPALRVAFTQMAS